MKWFVLCAERLVVQRYRRQQPVFQRTCLPPRWKTDHVRHLHPVGHVLQCRHTVQNMKTREAVLVLGLLIPGHVQGHRRHEAQGLGLMNDVQDHRPKKQRECVEMTWLKVPRCSHNYLQGQCQKSMMNHSIVLWMKMMTVMSLCRLRMQYVSWFIS